MIVTTGSSMAYMAYTVYLLMRRCCSWCCGSCLQFSAPRVRRAHRRLSTLSTPGEQSANPLAAAPPLTPSVRPDPLPSYRPRLPRAQPTTAGLVICRFPGGAQSVGERLLDRPRGNRAYDSISFLLAARRRPARPSAAYAASSELFAPVVLPPPASRRVPSTRLLPCPPHLEESDSATFVSVIPTRRRHSAHAVRRSRAKRRLSAALSLVLQQQGGGGMVRGWSIWAEPKVGLELMSWPHLLCELREALHVLDVTKRARPREWDWVGVGAERRRSVLWWKETLLSQLAREGGAASRRSSALPLNLPMSLALILQSRVSPQLPASALLAHLRSLAAQILHPPICPHQRHTPPFHLLVPHVSRVHEHRQRRHLPRVLCSTTAPGWREVSELIRAVRERQGKAQNDHGQVLAETFIWFTKLVHTSGQQ